MIRFSDFSFDCLYLNKELSIDEFVKKHIQSRQSLDYFLSDRSYLHKEQKLALIEYFKKKGILENDYKLFDTRIKN